MGRNFGSHNDFSVPLYRHFSAKFLRPNEITGANMRKDPAGDALEDTQSDHYASDEEYPAAIKEPEYG